MARKSPLTDSSLAIPYESNLVYRGVEITKTIERNGRVKFTASTGQVATNLNRIFGLIDWQKEQQFLDELFKKGK